MTKIISFSLWGNDPKYTIGAIRNAELAPEFYPGWTYRFYVGEDVRDEIKTKLIDLKSEVIDMDGADWNGMFWRFFAADGAEVMISRDTDSRLGPREKAAVDEWLDSDRDFHIMRDHPFHLMEIMGGMWGCKNGIVDGITSMIYNYDRGSYNNKYQVDQNFLKEEIYPFVKHRTMVHDEYFEKKPFPTPRLNPQDFVGQVYDMYDEAQFK